MLFRSSKEQKRLKATVKEVNGEDHQMETEEEISPETNAEVDENLTEDAVEIDLEDEDLTELFGLEEEEEEVEVEEVEEVEEVLDAKIEDTDNEKQHWLEKADLQDFEDDELNDETVASEDSLASLEKSLPLFIFS